MRGDLVRKCNNLISHAYIPCKFGTVGVAAAM
jgi:hypothetical protein